MCAFAADNSQGDADFSDQIREIGLATRQATADGHLTSHVYVVGGSSSLSTDYRMLGNLKLIHVLNLDTMMVMTTSQLLRGSRAA